MQILIFINSYKNLDIVKINVICGDMVPKFYCILSIVQYLNVTHFKDIFYSRILYWCKYFGYAKCNFIFLNVIHHKPKKNIYLFLNLYKL